MAENLERYLKEQDFIQGLKEEHIQLMVGCAKNAVFKPGEFIFKEGQSADEFFILRQGRVALETHVPGRGTVPIQTISEGDVLGWSWLFPPYTWHFDARALETVRAISLDAKCLRGKAEKDAQLGYALMKKMAAIMVKRLQETRLQLMDIYGSAGQ